MRRLPLRFPHLLLLASVLLVPSSASATNGHVLHGNGSVSESMGGASIATSLDAIGSVTSNVSSASFLDQSSIEFAAEVFVPDRTLGGSVSGQASGTVKSAAREAVIPAFGLAYKSTSPWTFSFTAVGVGGFGVDYPGNQPNPSGQFNPLAAPQSAGGFGSIYSNYQLLQVTPSIAYQLTPTLSVGVGLDADWASLAVNPWPATPPDASGYPTGSHAATSWGFGVTAGATFKLLPSLALGASVKSPQWFDTFSWNSEFPDGAPTRFRFGLDYPLIAGIGASFTPVDPLTLALDLKWIDYADTKGFERQGFAASPTGPYVRGFGWRSIYTASLGAQYRLTPSLAIRAGYNYGGNPILSSQQFFNVFAPAIVQHHLSGGLGIALTDRIGLDVAYYHAFRAEETGPFVSAGAPSYPPANAAIPGTEVKNTLSEDSVSAQVAVRF